MKKYIFVVLLLLGYTHSADAYLTTSQNAFTVDNRSAIFTIDFTFGHETRDIFIPLPALLNGEGTNPNALGFAVLDEDGKSVPSTAAGIVLGGVPLKNGFYVIPKGKAATFTLLMIVKSGTTTETELHAQVTSLPFNFNGTSKQALNPSELQYYKTPNITLNKPVFMLPQ